MERCKKPRSRRSCGVSSPPAPSTPQKRSGHKKRVRGFSQYPHDADAQEHNSTGNPSTPNNVKDASSSHAACNPSTKLRTKGNALYQQASQGGFSPVVKRAKLACANQLYTQALHSSSTPDERASCCKNLGMLNWLRCKVELNEQVMRTQDTSSLNVSLSTEHLAACKFYLFEALGFLFQAKEHGGKAKPQSWLEQIDQVLISVVEWATEQSSLISISHGPLLQYLCEAFEKDCAETSPACFRAYKNHAEALFKEGLAKKLPDETMDYKGCHSLLHDCSVPLRKAGTYPVASKEDKRLLQEVQELQESVYVHQCICEAMQAIDLGDKALSEALMEEEDMDMERVKDSLDHYRQASLATRELDMETEGIAMSRIGKVYSEVLKLHEAAHKYHFQATRLALTVMSPSISRAEWYKYSLEKVRVHQEKVAAKERDEHEKNRQPILQRLESKIAMLSKEADKSAESFLKYLYSELPHPDLKRNLVPKLGTLERVKAGLKKALLHYHPDSNVQLGDEWKVMCEEICKHLNHKYSHFKGG